MIFHCIIHQQVLRGKHMERWWSKNVAVKTVNFIRSSFLKHCKFKKKLVCWYWQCIPRYSLSMWRLLCEQRQSITVVFWTSGNHRHFYDWTASSCTSIFKQFVWMEIRFYCWSHHTYQLSELKIERWKISSLWLSLIIARESFKENAHYFRKAFKSYELWSFWNL